MEPIAGKRSIPMTDERIEHLAELMVKPSMLKDATEHMSTDLEWDNDTDFVASDEVNETRSLLHKDDDEADRWWSPKLGNAAHSQQHQDKENGKHLGDAIQKPR